LYLSVLARSSGSTPADVADALYERRSLGEIIGSWAVAPNGDLPARVIAMLSANSIDPDLAAEIYVLDAAPDYASRAC
jgi:hypothetical protein